MQKSMEQNLETVEERRSFTLADSAYKPKENVLPLEFCRARTTRCQKGEFKLTNDFGVLMKFLSLSAFFELHFSSQQLIGFSFGFIRFHKIG